MYYCSFLLFSIHLIILNCGCGYYLSYSSPMHTSMFPIVLNFLKFLSTILAILILVLYSFAEISVMQVKGAQLWGTDIYTNDSDLVAGKFLPNFQTLVRGVFYLLMCICFSSNAYWLLLAYILPSTICHPRTSCNCSSSTTTRE